MHQTYAKDSSLKDDDVFNICLFLARKVMNLRGTKLFTFFAANPAHCTLNLERRKIIIFAKTLCYIFWRV
jgi:hypothetical protein